MGWVPCEWVDVKVLLLLTADEEMGNRFMPFEGGVVREGGILEEGGRLKMGVFLLVFFFQVEDWIHWGGERGFGLFGFYGF